MMMTKEKSKYRRKQIQINHIYLFEVVFSLLLDMIFLSSYINLRFYCATMTPLNNYRFCLLFQSKVAHNTIVIS
jgi:hypothetical protein